MDKNRESLVLKVIIIIFIVSIILFIIFNFFSKNKFDKSITFYLIGKDEINLKIGEVYQEEGFVATKNGVDLTNNVLIDGSVNTSLIGEYIITYSLKDDRGNVKQYTRRIIVYADDGFSLKGDSEIYLLLNGNYYEEGVLAFKDNVDYSKEVVIDSNLNVQKEGIYIIKYTFLKDNKTLERKVYVSDFKEYFKIEYSDLTTNGNVLLNINSDTRKISKYVLPNKEEKNDAITTYEITENGLYQFVLYDKYNNSFTYDLNINNIDRVEPIATCTATYNGRETIVKVTSDKEIKKYVYNGLESTSDSHIFQNRIDVIDVWVYDMASNKTNIQCNTSVYTDKLEIHFIASGHYDDAILIRSIDKTILIDSGRYNCRKKVTPYIQELGVSKIDVMIGSHLHNDHIAAQADILKNFSVDTIYYPDDVRTCAKRNTCDRFDQEYIVDALNSYNKNPIIVGVPKTIEIGEMTLYFLAPHSLTSSQNNNSFIFILKFRNNTFMFTGDAGSSTMNLTKLKNNANALGINLKVDVLKYPHHGNQTLAKDFLNELSPKYVIVPNYLASKYPNSTNKSKIINMGAKMYRQSDSNTGNLLLKSDGTNIEVIMNVKASDYKK